MIFSNSLTAKILKLKCFWYENIISDLFEFILLLDFIMILN